MQDEDFRLAVEQFEPNGCSLAVDEKTAAISPDVLYNAGGMKFDVMSFAPYTGEDGIEQVLTAFGLHRRERGARTKIVPAGCADSIPADR